MPTNARSAATAKMKVEEFDAGTAKDGSFERYAIPIAATCSSSVASSASSTGSAASSSAASAGAVSTPDSITGQFRDIERKYDVDSSAVLGTGSQAHAVRECTDRVTGRRYAVKSIRKGRPGVRVNDLHREVALLREMDHENVLRLVDVFEDAECLHIVTDLYEGGELYDRIARKREEAASSSSAASASSGCCCFAEPDAARVLRQILVGVRYLHDRDVAHRDLKPENVLFETTEEDAPVRIVDFGLARKHYRDDFEPHMSAIVGSSFFLAPEVLRGRYDRSCDLWSVGVIAYIVLCGYPPFNGGNGREVREAVRRGRLAFRSAHWRGVSREAKDFVRRLLRANPRRRMTVEDALDHPWIAKHNAATLKEEKRRNAGEVANERPVKRDSFLSFGGIGQGKLRLSMFRH